MQLSKTFKIPMYFSKINFRIVDNVKESIIKIYNSNNIEKENFGEYRGIVFNFDIDKFYILLAKEHLTHGLIAHEIQHVIFDLCEINSLKETEAQTFLAEYIHTEIYKFLNSKNIKIA